MVATGAFLFALLLATPDDYLADAQKALQANQPAAAEPLLRKAIEADPGDYFTHFNLALALSLQHKDAEAIPEFRRTLELKPGLYEADLNLGMLLLRDKQPADALPVLKEASEAKPNEARPQLYYADALLQTGDAAQAESHYTAALAADPKSAPAQLGLARALSGESKLPAAAEHFRAAGYPDGLLEVAAAYEKAGRADEAIAIYKEFPANAAVRQHLGELELNNKDALGAIQNLEQAIRTAPTTANRLALADAYRMNKQPAKMLEQLQLAAAADPNNYDLRMAWARSLRDNHQIVPAIQQFLAATKLKPDSVQGWQELASLLIVNENYAEGLGALDRLHALHAEIPGDYFLRAITLDKMKQNKPALAAYQQFLAADNGAHPDQEFQARQRVRIIESELKK